MRRNIMKKRFAIGATLALTLCAGLYLTVGGSSAGAATGKVADHTLFDETSGDTQAQCRTTTGGAFIVYGSFRAITDDAVLRVTFQDGDFVDYPIPQDTSFSFQQAAGTTAGVDQRIRVTSVGTGDLVGWLSASRLAETGTLVLCKTT
jgi:hypothetical protein